MQQSTKKGTIHGPINNEKYTSVEQFIAYLSRTGFIIDEGTTSVTLTNQLFPDK